MAPLLRRSARIKTSLLPAQSADASTSAVVAAPAETSKPAAASPVTPKRRAPSQSPKSRANGKTTDSTSDDSAEAKSAPPVIDMAALRAQIPANVARIDAARLVPHIVPGIAHILDVDPSLPLLLKDEWSAELFVPFLKKEEEEIRDAAALDAEEEELNRHYQHISRGILAQQISGAAARSILRKFKLLYHGLPDPRHGVPTAAPDFDVLLARLRDDEALAAESPPKKRKLEEGEEEDEPTLATKNASVTKSYFDESALRFPHPYQVANTPTELLRSAGLSVRKAEYVVGLSKAFISAYGSGDDDAGDTTLPTEEEETQEDIDVDLENAESKDTDSKDADTKETYDGPRITLDLLQNGTDQEISETLVKLKGIGPWSAEMFLLFGLARANVFSAGDLGIQRGVARYLKLRPDLAVAIAEHRRQEEELTKQQTGKAKKQTSISVVNKKSTSLGWKMPQQHEVEFLRSRFAPYNSLLMMVLWKLGGMPDMDALDGKSRTPTKTGKKGAASKKKKKSEE